MRGSVRSIVLVGFLACTGAASAAGLPLGNSGWHWSSTQPTGEPLTAVAVAVPTTAYAVGAAGVVLKTTDAGATWSGVASNRTPTEEYPLGLSARGSALFLRAQCSLQRSIDGGVTFTDLIRIKLPEDDLSCFVAGNGPNAAAFTDALNGTAVRANGTVATTTDGGATFTTRAPVGDNSEISPRSVALLSPGVAVVARRHSSAAVGSIVRTTDGGITWTEVLRTTVGHFGAVTAVTPTTAYAVTDALDVYRSNDAGATWTKVGALPIAANVGGEIRISCATATRCLIAVPPTDYDSHANTYGTQSTVYRTDDGGATFTTVARNMNDAAFFSPTRAVAVGERGRISVSDDGGATWTPVVQPMPTWAERVRANPNDFAWVWNPRGQVATTNDRGDTWHNSTIDTTNGLTGVWFADSANGFAVRSGKVLRTTDAGANWTPLSTPATFVATDVVAIRANRVVVLGKGGALLRSTDGRTFHAAGTSAVRARARHLDRAGSLIVASSARGIAITTDAGAHWRIVSGPRSHGRTLTLARSQCTSATVCWSIDAAKRIYRTINGGATWSDRTQGVGYGVLYPQDLAMKDGRVGYLTVRQRFDPGNVSPTAIRVLRTLDGGITWTPQNTLALDGPTIAVGGTTDYMVTKDFASQVSSPGGRVLVTTTGGRLRSPSAVTLTASRATITGATLVRFSGRLSPVASGTPVTLYFSNGQTWGAIVGVDGRYAVNVKVAKTVTVVAQWNGSATRDGDSSQALTIRRL